MTTLETIASVLALVPALEARLDVTAEGVSGRLYSECGKETSFYASSGAAKDDIAAQIGYALLRLAEQRQKGTP